MTEMENDMNSQAASKEPSRARQRKMKREGLPGVSSPNGKGSSRRNTSRQRTSRRTGPSVRERLAANHIHLPSPSLQSIQGKFTSRLGRKSQHKESDPIARRLIFSGALFGENRGHRKSENRRGEAQYEATPYAETQRKNTAGNSFLPRKNRRQYEARSEVTPPVMVRGGMGGMAFGRVASSRLQKQKAPKRRFDVPLKASGAEVRLPSIPLIHIGWRAVSLLLVFMMAAGLFLVWKSPVFQVKAVEAEGLKRLTASDLNTVMGTLGASIFTINPHGLEEIIQQAFPELEKVSVSVNLPANVKVSVVEREPVIAWTQEGSEVWVDARGNTFPPRGNPEKPLVRVEGFGSMPGVVSASPEIEMQNLPGVPAQESTTPASKMRLSPELVSAILALGEKMPAETLLVYDSEHGLGWNDPNGWQVFFGQEDQDMEMKLSVYETLVDHLNNEGIQPELISVEYVHAPYYRMER
jgi:hypothetical protein